jgi:hypothetical protein
MRKISFIKVLVFTCTILTYYSCKAQVFSQNTVVNTFKEIDSLVLANNEDSLFYCSPALIRKIEAITHIHATSKSGSFVGKLYFTKNDYSKWKTWQLRETKKGRTISKDRDK